MLRRRVLRSTDVSAAGGSGMSSRQMDPSRDGGPLAATWARRCLSAKHCFAPPSGCTWMYTLGLRGAGLRSAMCSKVARVSASEAERRRVSRCREDIPEPPAAAHRRSKLSLPLQPTAAANSAFRCSPPPQQTQPSAAAHRRSKLSLPLRAATHQTQSSYSSPASPPPSTRYNVTTLLLAVRRADTSDFSALYNVRCASSAFKNVSTPLV